MRSSHSDCRKVQQWPLVQLVPQMSRSLKGSREPIAHFHQYWRALTCCSSGSVTWRHGSAIIALRFFQGDAEQADLVQRRPLMPEPREAPIVLSPRRWCASWRGAQRSSWTWTAQSPPQPSQKVAGFGYETHERSELSARQKHRHRDPARDYLAVGSPAAMRR
jgi:hypothetical protein